MSLFSTATLIGDALLILGIFVFIASLKAKKKSIIGKISLFLGKNSVHSALIVSTIATISSLTFSEVLGFNPCKLCWLQRIFIYPQVVVLGTGIMINDTKVRIYSLVLSCIGLLIAVYHILVQFFPNAFQCSDELVKCSAKQSLYYGYITIPVMSATAFAIIILLMVFGLRKKAK